MRCEARLPTAAAVRDSLKVGTAGELVEGFGALPSWMNERVRKDLLCEEIPDYTGYPLMKMATFTPDDETWWEAQLMGNSEGFKDRLAFLGLRLAYESLGPQRFWELARRECWSGDLPVSKLRSQFRQIALSSFSDEFLPVAQLYRELKNALLIS